MSTLETSAQSDSSEWSDPLIQRGYQDFQQTVERWNGQNIGATALHFNEWSSTLGMTLPGRTTPEEAQQVQDLFLLTAHRLDAIFTQAESTYEGDVQRIRKAINNIYQRAGIEKGEV